MGQNFDRSRRPATCLKIAGEALGLLGCVLKRLKILMKFNSDGPEIIRLCVEKT